MNEIGEWIQNIAVYLIISAAILHAVPENGYRKYIRFFSGLVLILLLADPLLEFTGMARRFETIADSLWAGETGIGYEEIN